MRLVIIAMLALLGISPSVAQDRGQGFAGLGEGDDKGFKAVTRDYRPRFPADYAAHPGFRVEWWYITANLTTSGGTPMGLQWTLFRSETKPQAKADGALNDTWSDRVFWMGHAAVTTADKHLFAEKFARGGSAGQAGARVNDDGLDVWIDDWSLSGSPTAYRLKAQSDDFAYDLAVRAAGPEILHGQAGVSVKSEEGQASYYFSNPYLELDGTVTLDGKAVAVSGHAWLDREWSSQFLSGDQKGWDWFSLRLGDGAKLMAFQLRSNSRAPYLSGTYVSPDGEAVALKPGDLTIAPLESFKSGTAPTRWKITVERFGINITVSSLNENAWMNTSFPYFEGPVMARGSHKGQGYLEMTGYQPLGRSNGNKVKDD